MVAACPRCEAEYDERMRACSRCGAPLPLPPGSVVDSRYEIVRLLGQGGMGMVYQTQDRMLGETIAMKVLRTDVSTPEATRRFRQEILLARKVSHRNVCRIHEYGEDGDLRFWA